MKALFIFELKELALKPLNIIISAVCLLATGLLFALPVYQFTATDTNGELLRGPEAIAIERELVNSYAGILSDEKIASDIASYQALFDNPNNLSKDSAQKALTDSAYSKYVLPYWDYWKLINSNYTEPYVYDAAFRAITELEPDQGVDFYGARNAKVAGLLNKNYMDWNYSETETTFFMGRISSIATPYQYGYHAGWEMLFSCLELFVTGIMGICICVSGVFCGEYRSGADSILLSSRYGRTRLLTAKLLAAFTYSTLIFTLLIATGCGTQLAAFGADGWDLPIQVMNTIAPYDLSLLEAALIAIATLYLILLGMMSFTLFLSAIMSSPVPVLAITMLTIMLPMFLGISETSGIWNRILVLLPYRAAQAQFADSFYGYFSYPIGHMVLDIVTVRLIVYAAVTIVFIPFTRRAWKRHQTV